MRIFWGLAPPPKTKLCLLSHFFCFNSHNNWSNIDLHSNSAIISVSLSELPPTSNKTKRIY